MIPFYLTLKHRLKFDRLLRTARKLLFDNFEIFDRFQQRLRRQMRKSRLVNKSLKKQMQKLQTPLFGKAVYGLCLVEVKLSQLVLFEVFEDHCRRENLSSNFR